MIHFVLGDTAEALIKYNDALKFETMKDIDDKIMLSQIHNLIGDIFCKQGRYAEALEKHYAALKICEVPGVDDDGWNRAYSFQCIGDVYKEMGDAEFGKGNNKQAKNCYTKATEINAKARSLWIEVDDIRGLAENDYVFGHIYFKIGDIKKASKYFNKSFEEYKKTNYSEGLNDLYLDMARLDSARGNYKRAFEFHKLYVIENKKREDQNVIRKAAGFKYKSKIEQREAELKLLSAENKLQSEVSHRNRQNKNIAYGVLVLVMLAGGLAFYIFRKRKLLQAKQAMISERLRISQELHDEVGATLSGIAMYSHLAKEQVKNPQVGAIENSLSIIQSNAGEMVNKLNDIVWLINPGQDSLQQLLQRLEDYVIQIAAVKNIRVKSNINGHHSANILPAETRRNIYLLFKEAINNAVKYSNATLLELYIKEQDSNIEISLKDDGDGFDMESVSRGNGLNNMQQRATDIKAGWIIESAKGKGTSISLTIKIP
ncbi:MAG: hypothetical protein IPP72_10485 [Chitinophagaceae bacterium]|nr:hypothetical protein [Chitinophagaceae bacterium]